MSPIGARLRHGVSGGVCLAHGLCRDAEKCMSAYIRRIVSTEMQKGVPRTSEAYLMQSRDIP